MPPEPMLSFEKSRAPLMTGRQVLYLLGAGFLFGSFWGCAAALPKIGSIVPGTYQQKLNIRVLGMRRGYLLHIPAGLRPGRQSPLVIVLHGAFSTPRKIEKKSGFSALADREGFLVAYPAGAYGLFGLLRHWNAGHCCGKAASDGTDDVGFLVSVIEDIAGRVDVDRSRIYMTGFSNGGMLTYRFAAERTNLLAAAAPLAASLGGRARATEPFWMTPEPKGPLPLIVFHAKDDPNVPYEGGRSPSKGGEREYVSVADSIAFWVRNNRCAAEPKVETLYGGRMTKVTWPDLNGPSDVVLCTLDAWGHKWPGRFYTERLSKSDPLRGFDAAEVIWNFFKRHSH
jgi:polyhydroxybutyrate depolymerase